MRRSSTPPMQCELRVGSRTIPYSLTLAERKSVSITVRPDLSVDVRAPQDMSPEAIEEVLQKRANWITGHLQQFAVRPPKQPSASPTTLRYLGQELPLHIVDVTTGNSPQQVLLKKGAVVVRAKNRDERRVAALLDEWTRNQAHLVFAQRMPKLLAPFKQYGVRAPDITVRRMKARWGSCSSKGIITLNAKLIHMEPALIDYVIMHELCHLIEHNHGKHFYALLTRLMPDWKQRREQLNAQGMPD